MHYLSFRGPGGTVTEWPSRLGRTKGANLSVRALVPSISGCRSELHRSPHRPEGGGEGLDESDHAAYAVAPAVSGVVAAGLLLAGLLLAFFAAAFAALSFALISSMNATTMPAR